MCPSQANLSLPHRYCNLRNRQALLYPSTGNSQGFVFGGHNAHQTEATANLSSQGLAGLLDVGTDVSSHNMRKTFATRLLSRGAAITDVQHLLGHSSVKTTEKAYAAFVKNERFKQTIDLLDQQMQPSLKIVR